MGQTEILNQKLFARWQQVPTRALKPSVVPMGREHACLTRGATRWSSIGTETDAGENYAGVPEMSLFARYAVRRGGAESNDAPQLQVA